MLVADLVVLPLGCLVCGLVSASSFLLRRFPSLRIIVYALLPFKVPAGFLTIMAAVLSLLFPYYGPPFAGNLVTSAVGVLVGTLLSLDILMENRFLRRYKERLAWVGNILIYMKNPVGLISLVAGCIHLLFPATPFF